MTVDELVSLVIGTRPSGAVRKSSTMTRFGSKARDLPGADSYRLAHTLCNTKPD